MAVDKGAASRAWTRCAPPSRSTSEAAADGRIDAFLKLGAAKLLPSAPRGGHPPICDERRLLPIKFATSGGELRSYVTEILSPTQQEQFRRATTSTSPTWPRTARVPRQPVRKDTGVGAVFRTIPSEVPTLESLDLPPIVRKFCDYPSGMVLSPARPARAVDHAGAMIDHHQPPRGAQHHQLEAPIEFVHRARTRRSSSASCNAAAVVRRGGARGDARGPGRGSWSASCATGHGALGDDRGGGPATSCWYPAHDQRREDHRPHGGRVAAEEREQTKGFLSQSLIGVVTQAWCAHRPARTARGLRGHLMNRAIGKLIMTTRLTCPFAAADGKDVGIDDGPGAARGDRGQEVDPETRSPTRRTSAVRPLRAGRHRHPQADVTQGFES